MSISERTAKLIESTEEFVEKVSAIKPDNQEDRFGIILEAAHAFSKAAKETARGTCVFPAKHPKVTDNKDHFPLNSEAQARNALARANQFSKAPPWYKGTLQSLVSAVVRKVHSKYKGIEISDAAKKPGKAKV